MTAPRRITLRDLLGEQDSCVEILAKAAKFYDGDMKLKYVPLEDDETPGQRAASIPRLGDVAACKKRGR